MTGDKLIALALQHLGESYVLGSIAPKNLPTYSGPWDCAEFASWLVWQASTHLPNGWSSRLYGCANNDGDPAGADAYSGFWDRDAKKLGIKIIAEQAFSTPGAVLLRVASHGLIGHCAISDGVGGTIEAHSTKRGVIRGEVAGRRWDYGVLIPWFKYVENSAKPILFSVPKIWRLTKPMMRDPAIKRIQQALRIQADGVFGRQTYNAVKAFQAKEGLVADGEVGAKTWAALFS